MADYKDIIKGTLNNIAASASRGPRLAPSVGGPAGRHRIITKCLHAISRSEPAGHPTANSGRETARPAPHVALRTSQHAAMDIPTWQIGCLIRRDRYGKPHQ